MSLHYFVRDVSLHPTLHKAGGISCQPHAPCTGVMVSAVGSLHTAHGCWCLLVTLCTIHRADSVSSWACAVYIGAMASPYSLAHPIHSPQCFLTTLCTANNV